MSSEPPAYEPQADIAAPVGPDEGTGGMGGLQRLLAVFYAPGEVFAAIAKKPTWVACLVLLTLIGVGVQLLVLPHVDMEATIRARIEQSGRELNDQQMDRALEGAQKFAWIGPIASFVMIPIVMLIIGALYLLGVKLAGSDADFLHTFSATLHAYWPAGIVKSVLTLGLLTRVDKLPADEIQQLVKSNAGAFLAADAPRWLSSLASMVDIFNIWTIALVVIGLSTVTGISRKRAGIVTAVLWGAYIAVKVGIAALRG